MTSQFPGLYRTSIKAVEVKPPRNEMVCDKSRTKKHVSTNIDHFPFG